MRALRYYGRELVRAEEIPIPDIGEDEVLVETEACGICSSDILDWYREPKAPLFFGHEAVGRITRIGRKVVKFSEGDRVFVHHHVPCMVCHYCRKGNYSMCDVFKKSSIDPGGFAEYIRVPGENVLKGLLKIPEALSPIEATFIEPLACCIQAARRAYLEVGDRVVIFGAGFNGLLLSIVAHELGALSVFAVEPDSYRAKVVQSLGTVDEVFHPSDEASLRRLAKEGIDIAFVTPPFPSVIESAINIVDKGGTVLVYAPSPPGSLLSIDVFRFYFSHLTIRASYSASPLDTRLAVSLLVKRREVFHRIPVAVYPFSDFERAFRDLRENPKIVKVVLSFKEEVSQHEGPPAWY